MSTRVDTDVLIWHLRGYPQATMRLDQLPALILSSLSYFEILQGVRNKVELQAIKKMLGQRRAPLLPLTPAITVRAGALLESADLEPRPGHGGGLDSSDGIGARARCADCQCQAFWCGGRFAIGRICNLSLQI